MYQIIYSESHEGSSINRFGTGNFETLQKPQIREELIKFHRNWYSSNIMSLVLLSSHSLEEMESWSVKYFESIENKNVVLPNFLDEKPYTSDNLTSLYHISPVVDYDLMSICFPIPYHELSFGKADKAIITSVLGHEGERSLLS